MIFDLVVINVVVGSVVSSILIFVETVGDKVRGIFCSTVFGKVCPSVLIVVLSRAAEGGCVVAGEFMMIILVPVVVFVRWNLLPRPVVVGVVCAAAVDFVSLGKFVTLFTDIVVSVVAITDTAIVVFSVDFVARVLLSVVVGVVEFAVAATWFDETFFTKSEKVKIETLPIRKGESKSVFYVIKAKSDVIVLVLQIFTNNKT